MHTGKAGRENGRENDLTEDLEILQGAISAVVYQNYENGYAVLRVNVGAGQNVTVVGTIPLPAVGERLMVTGKWSTHSSYGRQFEAEFLERLMPQTSLEILNYLSSRIIKGIGPKTAARIVEHFGEQTLLVMEREPERLAEVPGISREKAKAMGEEFRLQVGMRQLMEFFAVHHLPAELAVRAYKLYGDSTVELLYDDPYLLMDEGLDAPFGAVDRFAIELGVAGDDPRRVEAGILFELNYNLTAGHSFLPEDKLQLAVSQLLSVDGEAVKQGIGRLLEADRLVRSTLAGITVNYLPRLYEAEVNCSRRLLEFAEGSFPSPKGLERMIQNVAEESGVEYSEEQTRAIREAATSGLLLITGGPGTGKTTILNGILSLLGQMQLACLLAAPTGRAAKRLTEVTGENASTIHRLLEAGIDPGTGDMVFVRDEDNPLKCDAVIVDEMSMVDVELFESLLRGIRPGCKLVLVGDSDQLPSVGPGNVLRDLIASGKVPTVELKQIFRQAAQSLIVTNAHRIVQGEMPDLTVKDRDFFFLSRVEERAAAQTVVDLAAERLPKSYGFTDIQVLAPQRKGTVGVYELNTRLQERLNPAAPGKKEHKGILCTFREGDKVLQNRNNYDVEWDKNGEKGMGVYNGDIGRIRSIDNVSGTMVVDFDGRVCTYPFEMAMDLELAYAVTVHKSQGSEYDAVVLPILGGYDKLYFRNLLYTAVTRAKKLLVLVGSARRVEFMVENHVRNLRYTGLRYFLADSDNGSNMNQLPLA